MTKQRAPGRLAGRTIAVTGAARGIGLAIAEDFAAEGADLLLVDLNGKAVSGEAARLRAAHPNISIVAEPLDITAPAAVAEIFAAGAAALGPFDGLVNNAGVNVFSIPLSSTREEWERCFAVNLEGAWSCCRAVLPGMIAMARGSIVNIASTHAFTIIPGTFPYPLAKHALLGLTRLLGLEHAAQGVRVNAIAPGYVATHAVQDWWAAQPDPEAARARTLALHPSGTIAEPAEIARAATFMISDECRFMNAACLVIDGGLSVRQHA